MENKKIGLLTMPLIDNYGGIIQIAALYRFLEQLGYEPYLIDKKYDLPLYKVIIKKFLERNPFYRIYDLKSYTKRRLHLQEINKFIEVSFVNRTNPIFNQKSLIKATNFFDAIIVGSDQVWRYNYVKDNYKDYFLSFASKGIKKIAYAASFGTDEWEGPENTSNEVAKLLMKFNAISVREDTGVILCNRQFNCPNVVHVLDPTFLPDFNFYKDIIAKEKHSKNVELFNYVLDNSKDKENFTKQVSNSLQLKISTIYLDNDLSKKGLKPSLSEWLYHFEKADFIITDSFHGMVFSIIFNKQFIALGNKGRGLTRFTSLLRMLGLENRLVVEKLDVALEYLITEKIDYKIINDKINTLKIKSSDFLINNLK